MFGKTVYASVLALMVASATAQTHTLCSPIKEDCPPAKALGKKVVIDYTQGEDKSGFFTHQGGTNVEYSDKGAAFSITSNGVAQTVISNSYIFGGILDVEMQVAPGQGIVTSIVLQSDDLDEIDWEWVGGDTAQVQTNYFSKGDTTTYDRGKYHQLANPQTTTYHYRLDWNQERILWQVNGNTIRELKATEAQGGVKGFPQTPCQIRLGTWVAGSPDLPKGTVDWAGGYTDLTKAPFIAYYKSITIEDLHKGATSYVYGDRSGTWDSIIVKTDGSTGNDTNTSSTSSKTSSSTTSKTSTGSSTLSTATSTRGSNSTGGSGNGSGTGSGNGNSPSQTGGNPSTIPTNAPSAASATLPSMLVMGAAVVFSYLVL